MRYPKLPTYLTWYRILIAIACTNPKLSTNRNHKGKKLAKCIGIPHTQLFRENVAKEIVLLKERPFWDYHDYYHVVPPELVFLKRVCSLNLTYEEKLQRQISLVESCITSPDVTPIEWIAHYNSVHNVWNAGATFYRRASVMDSPYSLMNKFNTEQYLKRDGKVVENLSFNVKLRLETLFLQHPLYADYLTVSRCLPSKPSFRWTIKKLPPDPQNLDIESKFRSFLGRSYVS